MALESGIEFMAPISGASVTGLRALPHFCPCSFARLKIFQHLFLLLSV